MLKNTKFNSRWPFFVPQFCFPLISLVKSSLALCMFALCNQLWIEKTWKNWKIGQLRASFTPQPDHLGIKTGSVLKIAWHQLQLSTIWPKSSEASFGSYKALNIPQNGFRDRKHHDLQNTGLCVTKASVEKNIHIDSYFIAFFIHLLIQCYYDQCYKYIQLIQLNIWIWTQENNQIIVNTLMTTYI